MAKIPDTKAVSIAKIFGPASAMLPILSNISCDSTNAAPAIAGIASKNEYLTAVSLSSPLHSAPRIVDPEREMPGMIAIP